MRGGQERIEKEKQILWRKRGKNEEKKEREG